MARLNFLKILIVSALIASFSGCGGPPRPKDLPTLYPCSIGLTQDGAPLEGASVMFYSADSSFKWAIVGTTDKQGNAKMVTHGQFPGAPAGEYKIAILKTDDVYAPKFVDVFTLIDKKYTEEKTTPLSITIDKGKKVESFELGKPVREKLRTVVL